MTTTLAQLTSDLSAAVAGGKPARKASAPQGKASGKPAKAKPAPVAAPQASGKPAKASAPQGTPARYALGKAFVAKSGGKYSQAENWTVVAATVPATKVDLIAAVRAAGEAGGYADRCNAVGFVQARIRKGHLIVV